MNRRLLVVALTATLSIAMALPAGAAPPTVPITADCDEIAEPVTFDFIAGDGSLVGFVEGEVVVIHKLDVSLTTVITVTPLGGDPGVYTISQDFPLAEGGSQGLKDLTHCSFTDTTLADENLGPLTKALVKQAKIFYGVDINEPLGSSVHLTDSTSGELWVQFPRS